MKSRASSATPTARSSRAARARSSTCSGCSTTRRQMRHSPTSARAPGGWSRNAGSNVMCSRRWASSSRGRGHDCAVEGLARLLVDDDAPAAASTAAAPEFVHGDILAALPELEVSHAYVASLLFDDCMLAKLGRALGREYRREYCATLSDFPSEQFDRVGKRRAAMSWNAAGGGTDVFLYQRRRPTLFGKTAMSV